MNKSYIEQINKKLDEVDSIEKRRNALMGLSKAIVIILLFFVFISLLELIFNFSSPARTFIFFSLTLLLIIILLVLVISPIIKSMHLFKKTDYYLIAKKVGLSFPQINDELLNALQLIKSKEKHYSYELIEAAFERIFKISSNLDLKRSVDFSLAKKKLQTAITLLLISSLLFLVIPGFRFSAYRIFNYNKDFSPPKKFSFVIQPGNIEITKGDNAVITIIINGERPTAITLNTKSADQPEFERKTLLPDSLGKFIYKQSDVKNSFQYFAQAEDEKSDVYKISVINRPIISSFELSINPPAYSKLPQIIQKDNGNASVLPGSKISVRLISSRELSEASILFDDSTKHKMSITNDIAKVDLSITKPINYSLHIADIHKIRNVNPITYSIQLLVDLYPSIELIAPTNDVELGLNGKVQIINKIKDDFGFSALNLNYKLVSSKYRTPMTDYSQIKIPFNKELLESEIYFVWDLAPLFLAEGESLAFYLEVFDNDNVSGPKSTKTELLTVRVPSIDQLYQSAEKNEQESSKDLEETFKEAEKLNTELQKITNDLKQNSKEISWQEKERIEKASQKFKDLLNKTSDISDKLNEMQKKLRQNNLLSEETVQKYNELQELLEQFNSDELREAFKRLQESLQSLMRDNVQISLDELKANEEYFKKSLERTINLLKRVQIEQKLDELIKRTEDLLNKLEEISNKTEQSNIIEKSKRDELSKRQGDISTKLEQLKKQIENLSDKMNELSDMPNEEMEKLQSEFEKQMNEKLSEQIKKEIEQMQKMEALKNQNKLAQNLQTSKSMMQSLQATLQQINQMKTFYDMMKILDDLITLSKDQEDLKNQTSELPPLSEELNKASREQSQIQNNLGKILHKMSALSQKTFAITPEMGKALGRASSEMQQSITWLQNGNSPIAAQKQTEAMKNLNEAASLMKGGMDQLMSGGQKGGLMSMMQQLQMMAQQQMQLNQLTQMLNQGQFNQETLAQMQRLAQQQELIRKSLEQLNRESQVTGESKRLAANLEKILEEMKEVVSNLQTEKLDDSVIKQQERILSKLLDAQRSINERDYEKERKSTAGQNIDRKSPPDLILSTEEGKDRLRDELMKAIREGYKKDYEELIRKYFEVLEKKENKK